MSQACPGLDPGNRNGMQGRVSGQVSTTYVDIALIAMGLLQFPAIEGSKEIRCSHHCWMHPGSTEVPSEEMVKTDILHEFYRSFRNLKRAAI
jgi:hypothetical protein